MSAHNPRVAATELIRRDARRGASAIGVMLAALIAMAPALGLLALASVVTVAALFLVGSGLGEACADDADPGRALARWDAGIERAP